MGSISRYVKLLEATRPAVVIATGPAGTSKTYNACAVGVRKVLSGQYKKLVLTRPTVTVECEELGYLPGDLNDKMLPWIQPCIDAIGAPAFRKLNQEGKFEICPLGLMRGRTFENSFVIADEMQNASESQIVLALTRIGFDTKMVLTGDPSQTDIDKSGFTDLVRRIRIDSDEDFQVMQFGHEDIRRSPVVSKILRLYSL
jgi:phosphate starvation-inducible PhoH-like protein